LPRWTGAGAENHEQEVFRNDGVRDKSARGRSRGIRHAARFLPAGEVLVSVRPAKGGTGVADRQGHAHLGYMPKPRSSRIRAAAGGVMLTGPADPRDRLF